MKERLKNNVFKKFAKKILKILLAAFLQNLHFNINDVNINKTSNIN